MGFVVAQIVAHTMFGLIIRHARTDPQTYFRSGAVNYWAAMALALVAVSLTGGLNFEWPASLLAVYQGVQYQLAYIVLFTLIAIGGLAVTFTILRMSVVVPIFGSIFIWGESPELFRIAGIILMLAAITLLGADVRRSAGPSGIRLPALDAIGIGSYVGCRDRHDGYGRASGEVVRRNSGGIHGVGLLGVYFHRCRGVGRRNLAVCFPNRSQTPIAERDVAEFEGSGVANVAGDRSGAWGGELSPEFRTGQGAGRASRDAGLSGDREQLPAFGLDCRLHDLEPALRKGNGRRCGPRHKRPGTGESVTAAIACVPQTVVASVSLQAKEPNGSTLH